MSNSSYLSCKTASDMHGNQITVGNTVQAIGCADTLVVTFIKRSAAFGNVLLVTQDGRLFRAKKCTRVDNTS